MKLIFCLLAVSLFTDFLASSQERESHLIFWEKLEAHCGKSYTGEVVSAPVPEDFQKKDLIIHFKSCGEGQIRILFMVGENRSRTWVFTLSDHNIELKHDHRNKDGSSAEITLYGGTSPNTGFEQMQYFPADQQTVDMISYAAGNVWWVSICDSIFTYNLRRVSSV